MEYLDFFRVAPQWATLIILGALVIKKVDFNKMFGRQLPPETIFVKRDDCHSHIDRLVDSMKEIKDDIRDVRAIIIKHIEKGE